MPWNSTTKKIVGAADINSSGNGDIQLAAKVSDRYDIGNIIKYGCQAGNINKWSRIKPIHYPGKFKLSLEDFKGHPQMVGSGIVYGLAVPQGISSPTPAAIHATSWDYVGYPNASGMGTITGGDSPYRFFDFIHPDTTPSDQTKVGYSENARADIGGGIPSDSEFWINGSQSESAGYSVVNALYDPNNTEGINIAEYVVYPDTQTPIGDLTDYLKNCYPGILIGDYITALTHGSTDTALPLCRLEGGQYVWTSDYWYVDMSKVLGKGTRQGLSPWASAQTATASLVLIFPTSGNTTYIAANDPATDITRYWVYMPTPADPWAANFFPIPGATGQTISLTKHPTDTLANVDSVEVVTGVDAGIKVYFSFTENYSSQLSVQVAVDLWQTSPGSITYPRKTITVPLNSATAGLPGQQSVIFGWDDKWGIMVASGDSYKADIKISTIIGSHEPVAGTGITDYIINI